jgi:replicative DNA helicase
MNYKDLFKKLETQIKIEKPDDSEAIQRLKEMGKVYDGEDQIVSSEELIEAVRANMGQDRIMSGFSNLDSHLKGFRPNQLIVLSALTKSGKTSFCMDLTTKLADKNPLWFSFEESADELIEQYIERDQTPPHFVTPKEIPEKTLQWVESKIIEGIAKYNSKIVFIDHLDFIVPFGGDNRSDSIAHTMRELKGIARRWNIVVFLLCHVVKAEMDKQPTLNDLRGSSSIAQEADTVMLLWRETKKEKGEVIITNNVNLSIQAARRGSPGNIKMVFKDGHFYEEDWQQSQADKDFSSF